LQLELALRHAIVDADLSYCTLRILVAIDAGDRRKGEPGSAALTAKRSLWGGRYGKFRDARPPPEFKGKRQRIDADRGPP
jgi:hypothetical protein